MLIQIVPAVTMLTTSGSKLKAKVGLKFYINRTLWLLKTISCKLFRQAFGYLMHSFVNVFVLVP